ncbi:cytosolic Cu/Zn superoxide dismutase, partial [Alternaria alternata]
ASAVAAQSSTVIPAPVVTGNPIGAKYVGTLPPKEGSTLTGSIEATTGADGKGVKFSVSFAGLPETGGPFMYHLHAKPVPADGNCTGTGAHLDPYMRGEVPGCDASKPETCQTGDLSGKYGNATEQTFSAEYTDLYSATLPSDPAFFGALSFVVHLSNKTRIGCANFTMIDAGYAAPPLSTGYPMMPPTNTSSGFAQSSGMPLYNATTIAASPTAGLPITPSAASSSAPAEFTAGAAKIAGGAGALLAAAAAALV